MRPIRLELQAFASYGARLEIDFVALARHGAFSITGPTGSGKTSIFDAIVYALYGELPGYRKAGDVRSHYADPSLPTSVLLEFEVKGTRWTIERSPDQDRPKQRGEGTTKQAKTVILRQSGASAGGFTKEKDVDAEIEQLIGLTARQFQQVILLPQGQFEAVLKAETKDRRELLERLFPVDVYKRLIELLKVHRDEREGEIRGAEAHRRDDVDAIRDSLASVTAHLPEALTPPWAEDALDEETFEESALPDLLSRADTVRAQLETLADQANTQAELRLKAADQEEAARNAFIKWRDQKVEAQAFDDQEIEDAASEAALERSNRLSSLTPTLDALVETKNQMRTATEASEAASQSLAAVDSEWTLPEDLKTMRTFQQEQSATREAMVAASTDAQHLRDQASRIANLEQEAVGARTASEGASEAAKSFTEQLKAARKTEADYTKALKGLSAVQKREGHLSGELEKAVALADAREALAAAEAKFEKAKAAEVKATAARDKGFARSSEMAAAQLATLLVPGEACAVCGALEHPTPARPPKGTVSVDLEGLQLKVDSAIATSSAYSQDIKQVQRAISKAGSLRDASEIAAEMQVVMVQLTELEEKEDELDELRETIAALDEQVASQNQTENDARAALATATATLGEVRAAFKRALTSFEKKHGPYGEFAFDVDTFDQKVLQLGLLIDATEAFERAETAHKHALGLVTKEMAELFLDDAEQLRPYIISSEEMETRRRELTQRRVHRIQTARQIKEYEESGAPQEEPSPSSARELALASREEANDLLRRSTLVGQTIDSARSKAAGLGNADGAIAIARAAFEEADTLYKLCAGQQTGVRAGRIALDEWVLADYLRKVLHQANIRLLIMTNGRYQLEINSQAGDGRGRHSLDLEIFDANTGQARPASTMSGGETFMAALALALGLADVVSSGRNRDLGALFIDEGFGTLDEGPLEAVIEVLDSLQQGGRMVGVISHVDRVKTAIPTGIEVTSDASGSLATTHYPEF